MTGLWSKLAGGHRRVSLPGGRRRCRGDLHGDLPAEPGWRGQVQIVAAPEPAGVES